MLEASIGETSSITESGGYSRSGSSLGVIPDLIRDPVVGIDRIQW